MSYETKHTPGPWSISTGSTSGRWIEPSIAHVYGPYGTDEEGEPACEMQNEANAHLIAAAPDLLSALINLLDYPPEDLNAWANGEHPVTMSFVPAHIKAAVQAIEKALNIKTSQP